MQNNIFVLYGSQTGNAEEIAKQITELLNDQGYDCTYSCLNKTIQGDHFSFVPNEEEKTNVIIVCSTTGNGDAPESADYFWRKVKNRKQPKNIFVNVQYAVLGLGNTNYDKFSEMGKKLDKRFHELGGTRLFELHCADEVLNYEDTINTFINKVLHNFILKTSI